MFVDEFECVIELFYLIKILMFVLGFGFSMVYGFVC